MSGSYAWHGFVGTLLAWEWQFFAWLVISLDTNVSTWIRYAKLVCTFKTGEREYTQHAQRPLSYHCAHETCNLAAFWVMVAQEIHHLWSPQREVHVSDELKLSVAKISTGTFRIEFATNTIPFWGTASSFLQNIHVASLTGHGYGSNIDLSHPKWTTY